MTTKGSTIKATSIKVANHLIEKGYNIQSTSIENKEVHFKMVKVGDTLEKLRMYKETTEDMIRRIQLFNKGSN